MAETRWLSRIAAATLVVTTPLITFWLLGDQSLPGDPNDLDYLVRSSISPTTVLITGALCSLAFVAAGWYLRRNRFPPRDNRVAQMAALLMFAGVVFAFGARTVTVGVIGANIGGGLYVMMGLPFCAALVVLAVVLYWRSGRPAGLHPS